MTTIDSKKQDLADTLESAADTLRSKAGESAHALNDLAKQAGKKLDSTASCVRSWNLFGGLRNKVNRSPIQSLAVAAAIGLIAGVSWRATR